jgi:uncharacterized protein
MLLNSLLPIGLVGIYVVLATSSCDRTPRDSQANAPKCAAIWYNAEFKDQRCYELQEQLLAASVSGDVSKIKELVDQGANVNGGFDQSLPVLEVAAYNGKADAVRALIRAGARVNRVGSFGETALKSAVYYKQKESVKVLIELGADVCEKTETTALQYAIEANNQDIITMLEAAGANECK